MVWQSTLNNYRILHLGRKPLHSMETNIPTDAKYYYGIATHCKLRHLAYQWQLSATTMTQWANNGSNHGAVVPTKGVVPVATNSIVSLFFTVIDPLFNMTSDPLRPLPTPKLTLLREQPPATGVETIIHSWAPCKEVFLRPNLSCYWNPFRHL